jgi:two-component sensor histidine kinase
MLLPESLRGRHVGHRAGYVRQPHNRPMGLGMDLVARRNDGSEFPVEISLSHVEGHQNGVSLAFIYDISARKQASREREGLIAGLEAALSEKTVLLKEVHHRVKNNLAVIAGLLGLQADALDDERAQIALGECQQRVASMALIHEYLYSTEHLDRVNFGKYVHQLASELCGSYAIEADLVGVSIHAEEIDLPVHRAIPCGLILNELLSNALKYAVPDGRSGAITVRFCRLESGELVLSCADNGVGIPESFDWEHPKSLGLRIVQILSKQIDGTLTLDRSGGGTRFDLRLLAAGAHSLDTPLL